LVVVSIVVVITALLLVRQSRFNSSTLLRSVAFSIAFSVAAVITFGSST
jgi:hypothetical protein